MHRKPPESMLWQSRPSLRFISLLSQQKLVSRWALLGTAIQRALHTVPWHVHYETFRGPAALNTLVGYSGPTGTGKTLSGGVLERHVVFPDNDPHRRFAMSWSGFVEPGSGEAMPDYYVMTAPTGADENSEIELAFDKKVWAHPNHAAAFSFDEVGMLDSRNSRQGSTITDYLKQGYSGSEFGRVLKGRKGTLLAPLSYRFSCGVNLQPARAGSFFTEAEIAGGLPSRFLWVNTQDPSLMRNFETVEFNPLRVAEIDWAGIESMQALPTMNEAHIEQHFLSMEGKVEAIDSHLLLTRAKVACALAVLDNRPVLNQEDWELSEIVMEHSRRTRDEIRTVLAEEQTRQQHRRASVSAAISAERAEAEHQRAVRRVAKNLAKAIELGKAKSLDDRRLQRSISSRDRDYLDEAREYLRDNPNWSEASG